MALKKKAFSHKNFEIPCSGSKVPLWQFRKDANLALLNHCMEFQIFVAKCLNAMKKSFRDLHHNVAQSQQNPRFILIQRVNLRFLKNPSPEFNFFNFSDILTSPRMPENQNQKLLIFPHICFNKQPQCCAKFVMQQFFSFDS